ncbi:hypothetical protein [Alkaliphilus sp. B6464]|uniref:hypothetical protein n=1 Tax=Alkaliphilus sp. B6464 TaxID=2731219 RepID=UPI001BA560B5|nr:hypothetical protein [Alkaliphilus sp. B6464]QUH22113.1 hypothetical protein HYG84_19595 [Alkaliphilus sp. B6464]
MYVKTTKEDNFMDLFISYINYMKENELFISTSDNFIRKSEIQALREDLLKKCKSLDEVKKHRKVILENPWVDIFPIILGYHPDYFKHYFSDTTIRNYFKEYIIGKLLNIMKTINDVNEENVLNYTFLDTKDSGDGNFIITKYLFAKNYYKGIKLTEPILAKEIYNEAADGYKIYMFQQGYAIGINSYSDVFFQLNTDNGKIFLMKKIMENIEIDDEKPEIKIKPLLKFKDDILKIFEQSILLENKTLIYSLGEEIEYLITFTSIPEVVEFKKQVVQLLDKYSHIPVIKEYKETIYY